MATAPTTDDALVVRPASPDDADGCFGVLHAAVGDLSRRIGQPWELDLDAAWRAYGPIFRRLASHAAEWWVAEQGDVVIGYARSVERGGLFELAEFFVDPRRQAAGVGRRLLEAAFPDGRGEVRVIVATPDVKALTRYYRAGTVARFPIATLAGRPVATQPAAGIEASRATVDVVDDLVAIDRATLEFPRDEGEFGWLLADREGYRYHRGGQVVGYGFVGPIGSGPVAALDPADQVPILLHLEGRAAALDLETVSFDVPMINEVAMHHLLDRRMRIDPFLTFLLSSRPFGRFDRYIGMQPPFVL